MAVNIYIVEDHAMMRQALIDYFEDLSGFQVAGAVETAEEALQKIGDAAVDLVLVDTSLPNMNGIELIGECPTSRASCSPATASAPTSSRRWKPARRATS